MPGEVERKYGGLLEKKWTSVIRLQKKVRSLPGSQFERYSSSDSRTRDIACTVEFNGVELRQLNGSLYSLAV